MCPQFALICGSDQTTHIDDNGEAGNLHGRVTNCRLLSNHAAIDIDTFVKVFLRRWQSKSHVGLAHDASLDGN